MRILFVFKDPEEENLGVMYISKMLKENGHTVDIVNANKEEICVILQDRIPTILAFSTLAFYCDYYMALSATIKKEYSVFCVFGGQHPTGLPDIISHEGVDAVCLGEGEYPFVELACALEKGEGNSHIRNLWIKKNDKVLKNDNRPLIEDLDALPFPDRSLFKRKAPFFYERINMITSRGCAYDCPYCYNNVLKKLYETRQNTYRRRSVENVLAELREIKKRQVVKFILFHDDIFTLLPEWVTEFSEKYGNEFHIPFSCNIRIDGITEKVLQDLKKAGCHSVSFGLESGDDHVREDVLGKHIHKENMISVCRMIKKYGFSIRTTNIIGAATDSLETDIETLDLNIQCKVDMAKAGILSLYPSTDIKDKCTELNNKWSTYEAVELPWEIRFLGFFSKNLVGRYTRKKLMVNRAVNIMQDPRARREFVNFNKLFPLIVAFPFLFPVTRFLIRLPLGIIYENINFLWDNYCAYFRTYDAGVGNCLRSFIRYHKAKKD